MTLLRTLSGRFPVILAPESTMDSRLGQQRCGYLSPGQGSQHSRSSSFNNLIVHLVGRAKRAGVVVVPSL